MIIVRLTEELLPYFIFLMDEIEGVNKELVVSELLKECEKMDIPTSWHSLDRAFKFRQTLEKGVAPGSTYYIPQKKTLDALTKYCYGIKYIFRDLVENRSGIGISEAEVLKYYSTHMPETETLTSIFKKNPEKITHINRQLRAYNNFLEDLQSGSFEQFIEKEINKRMDILQKEVKDELNVKSELIGFLEKRVEKLERKRTFSQFIYRVFGSFGLFFVNIDYDEINKIGMLEDFSDNYQGLVDDDIIDDLL